MSARTHQFCVPPTRLGTTSSGATSKKSVLNGARPATLDSYPTHAYCPLLLGHCRSRTPPLCPQPIVTPAADTQVFGRVRATIGPLLHVIELQEGARSAAPPVRAHVRATPAITLEH